MVVIIGIDKNNNGLNIGDRCRFTIHGTTFVGIIDYEEDCFAYSFNIDDDNNTCILINCVDYNSIEKISYRS